MLCYKCGSHVPDNAESCPHCAQRFSGVGPRYATGTFSRRRLSQSVIEGAPYKPQDTVAQRYLIKDTIAAGPVGYVFRAQDQEIDVEVALKVINRKLVQTAEERKHFSKQIRLARKLSHPNLVRVYEEGEDQENPYYTSQFLDGLTLRKIIDLRLAKSQYFTLREIEPIFLQIAGALDAANSIGPHGGVKPDNVLVLPDLLKLTDFGLALSVPRTPLIQAMRARRADRYMAPEWSTDAEITAAADIYSLGVILGEMLCGALPDGDIPELQSRNPEIPHAIEGLYRKALNGDPVSRFKTADEMMSEISRIISEVYPAQSMARESALAHTAPIRSRGIQHEKDISTRPERVPTPPPMPTVESATPISESGIISITSSEILNPSGSGENLQPSDATQQVSEAHLKAFMDLNQKPPPPPRPSADDGVETHAIPSGQLSYLDAESTRALPAHELHTHNPDPKGPLAHWAEPPPKDNLMVWLGVLIVIGVVVGGGVALLDPFGAPTPKPEQTKKDAKHPDAKKEEPKKEAAAQKPDAGKPDDTAAKKAAVEPPKDLKAKEKADREKAEREKADREKAEREKAEKEKAERERVAREKADRDAKERAERELKAKEKAQAPAKVEPSKTTTAAPEKTPVAPKAEPPKTAAVPERTPALPKAEPTKTANAPPEEPRKESDAKKIAAAIVPSAEASPAAAAGTPCPDGMRLVAGGAFKMGTASDDPMMGFDEKKLGSVDVGAFCIDLYEFPNKRGAAPTVNVGFAEAQKACEGAAKRLCTEEEWEKACKGPGNARWPFGNTFDPGACNSEDESGEKHTLQSSGKFGKCRSGYAVGDMSGNAAEWTAPQTIKGGSFASADYAVRCSARRSGASFSKSAEVGLRCCSNPK